jgi:hypothetical protein
MNTKWAACVLIAIASARSAGFAALKPLAIPRFMPSRQGLTRRLEVERANPAPEKPQIFCGALADSAGGRGKLTPIGCGFRFPSKESRSCVDFVPAWPASFS